MNSLIVIHSNIHAVLINYNSEVIGWKTGVSGFGQTLNERINHRLNIVKRDMDILGIDSITQLNIREKLDAIKEGGSNFWFLGLVSLSSIKTETLVHAGVIFDHFISHTFAKGVKGMCFDVDSEKNWGKLLHTINELYALVLTSIYERLMILFNHLCIGYVNVAYLKKYESETNGSTVSHGDKCFLFESSQDCIHKQIFRYIIYIYVNNIKNLLNHLI